MSGDRPRQGTALSRRRFAAASGAALLAGPVRAQQADPERWTIVYAERVAPAQFRPYRTVVLDGFINAPTRTLSEQGKTTYARLNLFEIDEGAFDFRDVEAAKLFIESPANEPTRRRAADLRDPRWTRRALEIYAPFLLHKGFHGLLLNGLHRAAGAERADPVRFKGMTEAAVHLVLALRRHYPEAKLALKHLSPVLPGVEAALDAVVAVGTMGEAAEGGAAFRPAGPDSSARIPELQALKRRRPEMTVFTLDRWNPSDATGIARIYAAQRRNGFVPYVAGGDFHAILPEPTR